MGVVMGVCAGVLMAEAWQAAVLRGEEWCKEAHKAVQLV